MKIRPQTLFPPLVGVVLLLLVLRQTLSALAQAGAWQGRARFEENRAADPYARIDRLLDRASMRIATEPVRDPFDFGGVRVPVVQRVAVARNDTGRVAPPPAPVIPTLTSIVWDEDPRATIRYDGRDFSVRENTLFADFRVRSISRTEVVLDRGGESLVLTLR